MMQSSRSTILMALSVLVMAAAVELRATNVLAQNCTVPQEEREPNKLVVKLASGGSVSFNRVLHSVFQEVPTSENVNITGIITRGWGTETLTVQLADEVRVPRDLTTMDLYTALLLQIYPSGAGVQIQAGSETVEFTVDVEGPVGVFLLLTVDQSLTARFPACYIETLTFEQGVELSAAGEQYATALRALMEALQHKLAADPGWHARLHQAFPQRSPRQSGLPKAAMEALREMVQPLQEEFLQAVPQSATQ